MSRNTIQRKLVLEAVRTLQCHATAEQVYEQVRTVHPEISRATVYRNLEVLSAAGEIRKVETMSEAARYDHIATPHPHLRCRVCGRYFDMAAELLPELPTQTGEFHIEGCQVLFTGVCPECYRKHSGRDPQK